ncbi:hypothetical protein K470DRAFT_22005 [Piedraia hortae CBS 480.64]|uniref:Uncharacterized protein n=1 Tax=Piedraia hortae CBS 480.64 TaxID=1314780 RepID=A0A6A7C3W1_9PEZI|nr:hypothetical protein K470DRAFT_22005 [Piedraia hortae CBS 480.64]
MTERTFRSPSPHRATSVASDAPPVPSLPQNLPVQGHKRAGSMEPPRRMWSPVPARAARGSSVDRSSISRVAPHSDKRLSLVGEEDGDRTSINFSRPMKSPEPPEMIYSPGSRTLSPAPVQPVQQAAEQTAFWDPHTRSVVRPRKALSSSRPSPTRTAPLLHKQPSVVHESREENAKEPTKLLQASAAPTRASVARQRAESLEIPPSFAHRGRQSTPSPARSAHFSPTPVVEPHRHVPPPRDVSPVKSAMKRSTSSAGRREYDSMSMTSQDSFASKKRPARVSFDERSEEPGTLPEFMTPRPALPLFGSVQRFRDGPVERPKVPPATVASPPMASPKPVVQESQSPRSQNAPAADLPVINLLPPTPGDVEKQLGIASPPKQKRQFFIPGAWDDDLDLDSPRSSLSGPSQTAVPNDEPAEDDSDDSDVFSDASEDFSDDGAFASIDAIVEKPLVRTPPTKPESSSDWDKATAYWSRLSQKQKDQIEREHEPTEPVPKLKKKKSADNLPKVLSPSSPRPTMNSDGRSSTTFNRKGQVQRPQSDQNLKTLRPADQPPRLPKPKPGPYTTKVQNQISQDSDSESSFKRSRQRRHSAGSAGGRYTMRRSMRSDEPPIPVPQRALSPSTGQRMSGITNLRPLSPRLSAPEGALKKTLRDAPKQTKSNREFKSRFTESSDSDEATVRRRSRNRSHTQPRPAFRSRFSHDSSSASEDETFRFMPAERPIRGIPRTQTRSVESTDLDEEANELREAGLLDPKAVEQAMGVARKNLGVGQGEALAQGTLRGEESRKKGGGFKGLLKRGGKKDKVVEEDWPLPAAGDGGVGGTEVNGKREVYSTRTGRKKKFASLRRTFGLED